ncbi:hypothetical protein BH24ACT5_BH24ACT5_01550 [soil metagenome]
MDRARLRHVDIDEVIAAYQRGDLVRDVCAEHHVGLATLYRILDDHHITRRRPDHNTTIAEPTRTAVAAAYQNGEPVRDIAARHGVSYSTVSNIGRQAYAERIHVRRHPELFEITVRWFTGGPTTEAERDIITRAGVRTRLHGLPALAGLTAEVRHSVAQALAEYLEGW